MNKTFKLTCTAMLTALSVVANLFTITIYQSNAISFTFVMCFVAGVYLGIIPAIIVGYVGDLIAHFIHPLGAYNWFIALSSLLFGVICALCYKLKWHKLLKLLLATSVCFVVCTCFLNTFGLWLQYVVGVDPGPIGLIQFFGMDKGGIKKSFWVYLAGRAPFQVINTAVNAVIVATLQQTKALDKLFEKLRAVQAHKTAETDSDVMNASADTTEKTVEEAERTDDTTTEEIDTSN